MFSGRELLAYEKTLLEELFVTLSRVAVKRLKESN